MATASGIDGQVMWAPQTVYETYVAPTRALPFLAYDLDVINEPVMTESVRPGWFSDQVDQSGLIHAEAKLSLELSSVGCGFFLDRVNGALSSSGAGPYVHTYSPGQTNVEKSATFQFGFPNAAGTVEPWTMVGGQIRKASIKISKGKSVKLDLDLYGYDANRAPNPLATPSIPAGWSPFRSVDASLTLNDGGGAVAVPFSDLDITIDPGIECGRHLSRATTAAYPRQGIVTKERSVTGSISAEYVDGKWHDAYKSRTPVTMIQTIDAGASSKLVTTCTVLLGKVKPELKIGGVTLQKIPFRVVRLSTQTEAQAWSMVHTSTDTTP